MTGKIPVFLLGAYLDNGKAGSYCMTMKLLHEPVLLDTILHHLAIDPTGIYVDATFGRGGHSRGILAQLGPKGRLIGIDQDPDSAQFVADSPEWKDPRFTFVKGSFRYLSQLLKEQGVSQGVSGILLDLGVSTPQLQDPSRGFSFQYSGPLDMRMNPTVGMSAADWVNTASESEIAEVLWHYGEEKNSRRIAGSIVQARQKGKILTTNQLVEVIKSASLHRDRHKHPATRSFQAIRLLINQELEALQAVLGQAAALLNPGGRLCVMSFHSLEDRLVKRFFQQAKATGMMKIVTKLLKPTELEVEANPKARSALLRVGEKIT